MNALNAEVSAKLKALSLVYESKGDRWRAIAYAKAAKSVAGSKESIDKLEDPKTLTGVGPSIGEKIKEIVATGTCEVLRKFEAERAAVPAGVDEFQVMKGVGPKTALRIWKTYDVKSMNELGALIEAGRMPEQFVVDSYREALTTVQRLPREDVVVAIAPLYEALQALPGVLKVEVAGSIRRQVPMVGDVDFVVCCEDVNRPAVIESVRELLTEPGHGKSKLAGSVSVNGVKRQVDVSLTNPSSWGACLMYLTGSKDHNVMLRQFAKTRGWLLNEYGLWDSEMKIAGETEDGIYRSLGMEYLEPPEREGWNVKAKLNM